MTEFEMAYLFNDTQLAITANSSLLFTMVSAFLVASYVGAHRLSRLMISLLIGIYVYAFFGTALALERQITTMMLLGNQIAARASGGSDMQWHALAQPYGSPSARAWTPTINLAMSGVIFAGTIVFFFHCRRVNRKAEAGAWKPRT